MTTMFREDNEKTADGKQTPGPFSVRRILAFILALASLGLFVTAILCAPQYGWAVYIPGGACLIAAILLLLFTSWTDVTACVAAWKEK
jgi:hypothetical protein